MGRVRVRQHVNPLARKFQFSVLPPDWTEIYDKSDRPLHVDIGCGRGRFLWKLAQLEPDWNFLGLEIRKPLVEEANEWRDDKELNNLHYIFCNANFALDSLLRSLPEGVLKRVSILFPDPWFKNKHQRRRVVQPELVDELSKFMVSGGEVFLSSDVEEVAAEMRDRFLEHPQFQIQTQEWLPDNPLPAASEREIATLSRGEPVYRTIFERR
ncbi:tRNA (guanosine(46)-N7)-methyltransferase TrmB [Lyngbya sp. CCY1209]|uniref:tRNA (guanosine(46)-N7)-methyltransferase TrmB n=1 Tax=Lyngbya sp. CCY1209 TaxID=2886103 RepID=UPI002D20E629|nr:tRNA (guanosine(46)-N7)-methyltransferase TrmB [Lyngbya sp. CCY1209]MEB3883768.1 tRNA (guanosine(46)-N7)-methyltransferase TrmB [Lyngbya sp. CCY1209]